MFDSSIKGVFMVDVFISSKLERLSILLFLKPSAQSNISSFNLKLLANDSLKSITSSKKCYGDLVIIIF